MCTRYWMEKSPEIDEIIEEMNRSLLVHKWRQTSKVKDYGEMYPTDVVPVIAPNKSTDRAVFPMRWGYTGKSLLLNARTETAAQKPTFKEDGMPHFVILTREPGEEIRFIHDRMPLIMPEKLINEWIRPDVKPGELLPYALTDMIYEKATS